MSEAPKHKKIYAAGYYKGLEAAGASPTDYPLKGETMKQSRAESILANITASERKVYDALPIQQGWTISEITTALFRDKNINMQKNSVERCVKHLVEIGLASKAGAFKYVRTTISTPAKQEKKTPGGEQSAPGTIKPEAEQTRQENPIAALEGLVELVFDIAAKLEEAVQGVKSSLATRDAKYKKLEKLSEALKSLNE